MFLKFFNVCMVFTVSNHLVDLDFKQVLNKSMVLTSRETVARCTRAINFTCDFQFCVAVWGWGTEDNQSRAVRRDSFEGEECSSSDNDDLHPRPRACSTKWITVPNSIVSTCKIVDKLGPERVPGEGS